jgi:hypothetical protein
MNPMDSFTIGVGMVPVLVPVPHPTQATSTALYRNLHGAESRQIKGISAPTPATALKP